MASKKFVVTVTIPIFHHSSLAALRLTPETRNLEDRNDGILE